MRPVNIKFCIKPEYLDSAIAMGFLSGVIIHKELTEPVLSREIESKTNEFKELISLKNLDKIVKRELKIRITDRNVNIKWPFSKCVRTLCKTGWLW